MSSDLEKTPSKKDPLDEIISAISELLRVFHENKSNKRTGPLPPDFEKQLELLNVEVALFSVLHANALKEAGLDKLDIEKTPETIPDNLDKKSKRQLSQINKLKEEVTFLRRVFDKNPKRTASIKTSGEKSLKKKKTSISKHFGYKGWKRV
jgi:hypothetical protein